MSDDGKRNPLMRLDEKTEPSAHDLAFLFTLREQQPVGAGWTPY